MGAKDFQALIMAAGKGTRMRSHLPKVLHQLCGRSMLERTLGALAPLKPVKVVIVLGYQGDLVWHEIERLQAQYFPAKTTFLRVEQTEQRGTGHAVLCALKDLDVSSPTLILPGDMPLIDTETLREFLDVALSAADSAPASAMAEVNVLSAQVSEPAGFGRIVRRESSPETLDKIVEERDCTAEQRAISEINTSVYLVNSLFLKQAVPQLSNNNQQQEYYLTDIIALAAAKGQPARVLTAKNPRAVLGVNSRAELANLEKLRQQQINFAHMEAGVTMRNPDQVIIDEGVKIGADVYIGPGTQILGKSQIAENVRIDGNALIRNSRIASGAQIKLGCVIEDSDVGADARLGPYAHLRPGTVLERDVHLGNFVETKKTRMAAGAKANHLTYLGDTLVGEKVNVGAGTITCNYDGFDKFETVIEAGAFIGSNTSLVAPVVVGKGAVVGAGSVITKDVPSDSLALERSEQRVLPGWAKKKREKKQR